jgi:excisionase family DNA binding protein
MPQGTNMEKDRLIGIDEAASILALKPSTVRAMVRDKKLSYVHPAGARRVRFRLHYIEELAGLRHAVVSEKANGHAV